MAWNTQPQSVRDYLFLLRPTVRFKARVNLANASYPAHEIPFDGVTVGAYTNIQIGQTVLIGSSDGAWDLGWTYVRSTPTSSLIPIGWSSRGANAGEVTLTDNAYVTVLDTYEVWKKIQRRDDDAGVLYKDYNLPGNTPPSPIMHGGDLGGLGRVGFTTGGVLTIDTFDWSGSTLVNAGETWSDREWDFADGTITSGTVNSADPVVEFTEGQRWITLYGVGSDGGYTYRRYLVVALDPDAPDTVAFTNRRLRRTADGQTLTVDLQQDLDLADYPPGTVVLLLSRERRGSTVTFAQRFCGWLDVETSTVEAQITHMQRGATLTALDVAGKLAQMKAPPSTVANEASQTTWLEMKGANPERYIHRYLAFNTTALALTDWTLTGLSGSAAYPFLSFSAPGGSMWGVGDALAKTFGRRLTCDSQGRLWLKADPMRQNYADRTATVQRTITEAAWRRIQVQRRPRPTVGAISVQNVVISSGYASVPTAQFPDVYSIAPGLAAGQGEAEQSSPVGVVQSQTESNERLGHDYARATAPEGLFTIALAHGVDADIEPAHMTWVQLTATAGNRGYRGPTLNAESGLVQTVDLSVNAETGVGQQTITWERETVGTAGVRDPRPTASDSYVPANTTPIRQPSRTLTYTLKQGSKTLAAFTTGNELLITTDADTPEAAGGPTYAVTDLTALTNWGGGTLVDFQVDAFSPLYINGSGAVNGWIMTTTKVQRITDIFGTVALGTAHALPYNTAAGCLRTERGTQNWLIAVQYKAASGTSVAYTTDGSTWTNVTVNSNYDANYVNNGDSWQPGIHLSPHTPGLAYISAFTGGAASDGFVTLNYGATWSAISNPNINPGKVPVRSISVPYADEADSTVYYGEVLTGSVYEEPRLERVVGSGTPVDISPEVAGDAYGVYWGAFWNSRAISVSDGNRNFAVLCGAWIDGTTGDKLYAVFWTEAAESIAGAGSALWNVLVDPSVTQLWQGAYVVDTGAYLIGAGIARWDGQVLADLTGNMSLGSDTIKGICGG